MYSGNQITDKKAQTLASQGALLIDVRDPVSFRDGTVPGAVNMSLRQLSQLQKHPKTTKVVLIGDSETTKAAVNYMNLYGFQTVYTMTYGQTK